MTPSAQQEQIYDWFTNGSDHLVVRARAGCGKTTTVVNGVKLAPERSILICAFSKIIQEELQRQLGPNHPHIIAKTLHSVGYACIRRFRERIRVDFTSERADKLTDAVCGVGAPDTIKRLVSKLHTKGREIAPHATDVGDLTAIAITFECEPDDQWSGTKFDLNYVEMSYAFLAGLIIGAAIGSIITSILLYAHAGRVFRKYEKQNERS